MFFNNQTKEQKSKYRDFLEIVGCLSNLFSESDIPYLYYRVAEKIFCEAFEAEDLSRSDVSSDAKKGTLGIGLKTFHAKNYRSIEKVAEFNRDRYLYKDLAPKALVEKVAELRNIRIDFTEKAHNLESSIYHCVLRDVGKFKIFEESMDRIDIANIKKVSQKRSSIAFDDEINEYLFSLSKSTLQKRFVSEPIIYDFDVKVLENPLKELSRFFRENQFLFEKEKRIKQTVFLPLYGRNYTVFEKSGLNQWNAGGRKRHSNEVYIPIPIEIHRNFPDFFPDRDTPFMLKLPNNDEMQSKVCQENSKALMSFSNKELGKWILRDILNLKEGDLLTYARLQLLGIDSVRIDKIDNSKFEINFAEIGSYENFRRSFLNN
ncbi:MAG: NgoFVII family restriction endonuclease [bacterium]|nr:NgoFVII family restriction endonuclease [bacterium]